LAFAANLRRKMGVNDDILANRISPRGKVRCGLSSQLSPSVAELAQEFGLLYHPDFYREIDCVKAREVIELGLYEDLAYGKRIMSSAQAAKLASRFLGQFGTAEVRFFTNATLRQWGSRRKRPPTGLAGWASVTPAMFNIGVLVLGPRCSGCFWVEDED
jgi:hypothetical protein